MTKAILRVTVLALTALLFQLCAFGQVNRGTIKGSVADQSGAVVVGANVDIVNVLTGVRSKAETNAEGLFNFPSLEIGDYTVSATAKGFKRFEQTSVRLVSATVVNLDIRLQLGRVSETVSVTGQTSTVDTVSTSAGVTRVNEEIRQLPLTAANGRGRMVQAILRTYPGVTYGPSAYGEDLLVGYSNAMNGSNSSAEAYMIDGTSAATQFGNKPQENVGLNPEVVSELRFETNPNAEYGSNLGNTVSIVTKSGTNKFHAAAYGYYMSDKFNAASWFANANPAVSDANKRGRQHQAEEGLSGGGPILKDKLFFFTTWDRYHFRNVSSSSIATLPTLKMRSGDFSELLGPKVGTDALGRDVFSGEIFDPATNRTAPDGRTIVRDPFMYQGQMNVIDPARLSGPSKVLLGAIPKPNFGPAGALTSNWLGTSANFGRDSNRETLKVDWYAGKHRVSGAFEILTGFNQVNACVNAWGSNQGLPVISCVRFNPTNKRWNVSDTVALSPNLVLEGSFSRNFWTYVVGECCEGPTFGKAMGLQGFYNDSVPFIFTQNYGIMGYHIGSQNALTGTWNVASNLSWIKGKHSYKYGYLYERNYNSGLDDTFAGGWFQFNGRETALPGFSQTGWDWASLMLGLSDNITVAQPGTVATSHAAEWGFYAQDTWRVTSKLSVNYGLRWDIGVPGADCRVPFSTFDSTVANPAAGGRLGALAFYGPNNTSHCATRSIHWTELGPRLGLAYQLNPKTVLRAYYGITYNNNSTGGLTFQERQTRSGSRTTQDNGVTAAADWGKTFDSSIIPPSAAQSQDPSQANGSGVGWNNFGDNQAARAQDLGLGVERQLPYGIIFKTDYVGKLIHGLVTNSTPAGNVNWEYDATPLKYLSLGPLLSQPANSPAAQAAGIALPYAGFTGSVAQALRPYPQYTSVSEVSPSGYSTYHALQVTAEKRFGAGLSFLAAYTASKYLELGTFQHPELRFAGKALPSSGSNVTDRPQSLNISYLYELPFGQGKRFGHSSNPVVERLVSGWQVGGSHNYFSGMPLIITGNASTSIIGSQWVNRNPSVPIIGNGCHSQALQNWDPRNPNAHLYLNPGAFFDPPAFTLGNTRTQPSARDCGVRMENLSVFKDTVIKTHGDQSVKFRLGVDFFNAFNRHLWSAPNTNIDSPAYGSITGTSYSPRNIQFQARIEF